MRRGNEGGLELGWSEKNTTVEHFAEEAGVTFGVGTLSTGVVADGFIGEERRAERASGIDLGGNFCFGEGFTQAAGQAIGLLGDAVVEAVHGELLECGNSGSHCQRIAWQRA